MKVSPSKTTSGEEQELVDKSMRRGRSCGSVKSRKSRAKCARPGRVTRNSFFNFLRDFRKKCCGKSMIQIAREGGRVWRCLKGKEKEKYVQMACSAPKMKRKSHRKGLCRKIKSASSHKKCSRRKKRRSLASRCSVKRARRSRRIRCGC